MYDPVTSGHTHHSEGNVHHHAIMPQHARTCKGQKTRTVSYLFSAAMQSLCDELFIVVEHLVHELVIFGAKFRSETIMKVKQHTRAH